MQIVHGLKCVQARLLLIAVIGFSLVLDDALGAVGKSNRRDTKPPVMTAFIVPASSTSLTVSPITVRATDNLGIAGYFVGLSSSAPAANATGWIALPPSQYRFGAAGTYRLYAWAKDAAGNVSTPLSASVVVSLPDTSAPVISSLAIPATSTNLVVQITSLNAYDDRGVTGYCLSKSLDVASCSWVAVRPSSFSFSNYGENTLYAWVRDAAGNISLPVSASVVITAPDSIAPVVRVFSMPATSAGTTVPVLAFTADDNVGVNGYCITAVNSSVACQWTQQAPSSFTFTTTGAQTAYAWAKDAAGNVSLAVMASVLITAPHCSVALAWDPSPDPTVIGYKVYYGYASGKYDQITSVGNVTTYQSPTLIKGMVYYFAVTAHSDSAESVFSNEVSVDMSVCIQ